MREPAFGISTSSRRDIFGTRGGHFLVLSLAGIFIFVVSVLMMGDMDCCKQGFVCLALGIGAEEIFKGLVVWKLPVVGVVIWWLG